MVNKEPNKQTFLGKWSTKNALHCWRQCSFFAALMHEGRIRACIKALCKTFTLIPVSCSFCQILAQNTMKFMNINILRPNFNKEVSSRTSIANSHMLCQFMDCESL